MGAEEIFLTSIFHPVTEFQGSVCTRDGLSVHFHWRRLGCWQDKRRWEEWFHLLPQVEDFQLWRGVSSSQGSTQRRFTVQLKWNYYEDSQDCTAILCPLPTYFYLIQTCKFNLFSTSWASALVEPKFFLEFLAHKFERFSPVFLGEILSLGGKKYHFW